MSSAFKYGLAGAGVLAAIEVTFVSISVLTNIPRSSWEILSAAEAVLGLLCCACVGLLAVRPDGSKLAAAGAGLLVGALGWLVAAVAVYSVTYGLLDYVRQFPFVHYDQLPDPSPSAQAFLRSESGHRNVFEMFISTIPLIVPLGAVVGAAAGFVGGLIGGSRFVRIRRTV